MRQTKRLTLRIASLISIAFCALLLLQLAGIVPPLGVGWGDGTRGRAYSVEVYPLIVFRTAAGMRPGPRGGGYTYEVQSLGRWEGVGIQYRRWNMTAGRGPTAPVLGTFAEVQVAVGWPVLVSLVVPALWLMLLAKDRRLARTGRLCRNCGYDMRATPDRCPECGLVPTTPTTEHLA